MASGVVGKKIYTLGGEGSPEAESGVFNQVEVYDTLSNTWPQLEPISSNGAVADQQCAFISLATVSEGDVG